MSMTLGNLEGCNLSSSFYSPVFDAFPRILYIYQKSMFEDCYPNQEKSITKVENPFF